MQAPSGPQALAGVRGSGAATIAPGSPEREPSPPPAVPSPAREPAAGPAASDGALPNPRRALELIGLVVAPTTLVTALAFYFGWVLTNSRASYFGIDASALGYSTQDYLLRSADALFVPLGSVFVLALFRSASPAVGIVLSPTGCICSIASVPRSAVRRAGPIPPRAFARRRSRSSQCSSC